MSIKKMGILFFILLAFVSFVYADEKPIYMDKTVTYPVLIKRVEPKMRQKIAVGELRSKFWMVELVINEKGDVKEVKILKSMHPLIDQANREAMKQWKFKPALKNGKPVAVFLTYASTILIHY